MDKILIRSLEETEKGCTFDTEKDGYICNICRRVFESGEVFKVGERYFNAKKMAELHIAGEHGSMLEVLMSYEKRYTGITDNQKELLSMISSGLSDQEIAKKTGTAAATVRHQRFVFKEKAKQAKLYLAIYELAVQGKQQARNSIDEQEEFIDIHESATMVDDRYLVTKAEEETIISNMFISQNPLRLKNLSPKEKKKIVILKRIAEQFKRGRKYTEKELNGVLKDIYEDFATIRRYLIEYGFMDRTKDGKEYWLI
jgi:hypothetical protein